MELLLNKRVQMNFRIVVMIVEELKENVEEWRDIDSRDLWRENDL